MRSILGQVGTALLLMAIGAAAGILVVSMIDPACGPGGDEQRACGRELIEDLTGTGER